jgi:hypothetical protein
MKHSPAISPFSVALVVVLASLPVEAATYHVPCPELGDFSGRPATKLEVSETAFRRVSLAFIPAERDGSAIGGSPVHVDNDEKPNVFDVSPFIAGAGMLRLQSNRGLEVRTGALFLTEGRDTLTWQMPVLTAANWFEPGATAHLQNLARTETGHGNIEIINFGTAAALCEIALLRPKGSPLSGPTRVALLPVSHHVLEDPFDGLLAFSSAVGLRARVSCDQPFYAYGTFVGRAARDFRMLYPLAAPPAAAVENVLVDRPGTFFTASRRQPALAIALPLDRGRSYRRATIAFDVRIGRFTPVLSSLLEMSRDARADKTVYFGAFVRGARAQTTVEQGSPVIQPALEFATRWREGATHHVVLIYDTQSATVRMLVTGNGGVVADVTGGAFQLDLADRGDPVRVSFGLAGAADDSHFPPIGWKYSNLKIRIER